MAEIVKVTFDVTFNRANCSCNDAVHENTTARTPIQNEESCRSAKGKKPEAQFPKKE